MEVGQGAPGAAKHPGLGVRRAGPTARGSWGPQVPLEIDAGEAGR